MPTTSFMPADDAGKAELFEHFVVALVHYVEIFEISPEMLTQAKNDAVAFRYALNTLGQMQSYAQHWTTFKNLLRDGGTGDAHWPVPPKLEEPIPIAVMPGIVARFSALAARIKAHPKYTPAIGQDLWLIGTVQVIDPNTWRPSLSVQIKAGHPVIVWTKGKAGALEIWVDRGDGKDFVFLTINTEPNTTDNSPLPTSGTSAIWKYKAIYRLHDEQVGQWSDVVSIIVGG